MLLNHYSWWKNLLIGIVVLCGLIYALPNLYGEEPAVQVSALGNAEITNTNAEQVKFVLQQTAISYKELTTDEHGLIILFTKTDDQIKGMEAIKNALGEKYIVALNLVSATPKFLKFFGAEPMKLGLDLRGGIHFLLEVNLPEAIEQREEVYINEIRKRMREEKIRYAGITAQNDGGIAIRFRDTAERQAAIALMAQQYPEFALKEQDINNSYLLILNFTSVAKQEIESYAVEQSMTTLRNRVNELGVAEAVVQRQGSARIVVQLPGVLDPTRAKDILGKTARVEFRLVDEDKTASLANSAFAPTGASLYHDRDGRPLFLENHMLLSGDSIVGAQSSFDEYGKPEVQVHIGSNANQFAKVTGDNVGRAMAVIYIETHLRAGKVDGQTVQNLVRDEKIISVATIQSALGNRFRITGLDSNDEARNLALLLRAGALPATVTIVEERTIGPSLGEDNVNAGMLSVLVGLSLVVVAMIFYYRWFGVLANIALLANLFLLIAALSLVKATLSLPAIAAIVLTLGMAVDANVLIFERIREELRRGTAVQAAIYAGFEKALVTILDANITTFIAAIVLFTIGSGPIRGFAATLIFGLITSVFTAVMVTRALVNWWYGKKNIQKLSIGIKV